MAMDSTELLPKGINSPSLRYGIVSGIDSKYSGDGSVQTLNDINTIDFDSEQIKVINPEITTLVDILNQFSQQELGTQINLGSLRIETEPSLQYIVPVYARGITDEISVGVAAPVIFYKNKLSLAQSRSNVKAICDQFSGATKSIPEIGEACNTLDVNLSTAVPEELEKKGYKPIKDREETIFGDVQLAGIWKFASAAPHSAYARLNVNLPTGPKNDPDDLADLGIFGQLYFEPQMLYNWMPVSWARFAAKASYRVVVPNRLTVRVPAGPNDVIPGPEAKENVSQNIGDTFSSGVAANIYFSDTIALAGGYELALKNSDSYKGGANKNYGVLAKNSQSSAHKAKLAFTYDTIALYQKTKRIPPLRLEYEIANTFAGKNTERQIANEFSLTMFF